MKLFIATAWVLEVLVVVHFSHSSACLLEKKNVVAVFEGKIKEQDSEISRPGLQCVLEVLWEVWADLCISQGC